MKTLLIVADDKLGHRCIGEVSKLRLPADRLTVVLDDSFSVGRVLRLVRRGSMRIAWLFRMSWADLRRSDVRVPPAAFRRVRTCQDVVRLVGDLKPDRIVLFRCGLIINAKILACGVPVFNIHCADIPEYGGIGSICRALSDRAESQHAVLHTIESTAIDVGEVVDSEPYELDVARPYAFNEDRAYDAGIRLCVRVLQQ